MTTLLLVVLALSACHRHDHPHEPEEAAEELPTSAVTLFAAHTKLFVELPALVVGEDAPFAAHLTRLADFKPVEAGRVVAQLSGGAPDERFEVDGPSVPGIFRPVVRPVHAGTRHLRVRLIAGDLSDEHDLGEVTVHADRAAIAAPADEEPGLITFLKEQSWRLDFATAPVAAPPGTSGSRWRGCRPLWSFPRRRWSAVASRRTRCLARRASSGR